MRVRRLTPTECERLQGFSDDFTNIPNSSDSARYKSLGNSMAVPCMHWLGKRIQMVENIKNG
jgi:DNA (cytosine-5)-methyltransferase 1